MSGQNDARLTQIPADHSLVAATPVRSALESAMRGGTQPRPHAAFLVQLLACREGFAPYRRHRREAPAIAADRYARVAFQPVRTVGCA